MKTLLIVLSFLGCSAAHAGVVLKRSLLESVDLGDATCVVLLRETDGSGGPVGLQCWPKERGGTPRRSVSLRFALVERADAQGALCFVVSRESDGSGGPVRLSCLR